MRRPNEIPAALKNINVRAVLRSRGIYDLQKANEDLKTALTPLARQMVVKRQKPAVKAQLPRHEQFTNEEVMEYWEKQIHTVDVIEKKFDVKVQQFIGKVVDGFVRNLESEIATTKKFENINKDYFSDNEDDFLATAQLDFTPLLEQQAILAGQEALRMIRSKDVYIPSMRDQIAANVEKFTQSMLDTDRETLINIISNGLQGGKSVPDIRKEITDTFDSIQKTQAQRITRTEVLRASNQGSIDAWQQSGVVEGKQWLTAGAVDECADYEGDIVTLSGGFYDSESEFKDGDPPLHPNCRCVVLPVLVGEKGIAPQENKAMREKITELESQIDKRTKDFKQLKAERADDKAYIKSLEKYLGVDDE